MFYHMSSIKRKKGAITWQRQKRPMSSYLALKTRIYQQNIHKGTTEKSIFQFCLTITEPFSPFCLEEMKRY